MEYDEIKPIVTRFFAEHDMRSPEFASLMAPGKVFKYESAGAGEKEIMDGLMRQIDQKPDDQKAVCAYGQELFDGKALPNATTPAYIGAANELISRYDNKFIPEAKARFEASGKPEDEAALKALAERKSELHDRITLLYEARIAVFHFRQAEREAEEKRADAAREAENKRMMDFFEHKDEIVDKCNKIQDLKDALEKFWDEKCTRQQERDVLRARSSWGDNSERVRRDMKYYGFMPETIRMNLLTLGFNHFANHRREKEWRVRDHQELEKKYHIKTRDAEKTICDHQDDLRKYMKEHGGRLF